MRLNEEGQVQYNNQIYFNQDIYQDQDYVYETGLPEFSYTTYNNNNSSVVDMCQGENFDMQEYEKSVERNTYGTTRQFMEYQTNNDERLMEAVNNQNQIESGIPDYDNNQYLIQQNQYPDYNSNQLITSFHCSYFQSPQQSMSCQSQTADKDQSSTQQQIQAPPKIQKKQIFKPKKYISQPKKYIQDNLYKGVFQRLCILINDKPSNKSYKKHLIKIIIREMSNKELTQNIILSNLAQSYNKENDISFIDHLKSMLSKCTKKIDIEHPSVISALKMVYNSVKVELNNIDHLKTEINDNQTE